MRRLALILALVLLPSLAYAQALGPSSGGGASTSVTSGTTAITGGADKSVCFDDVGVINCGDVGFQYTKSTGSLKVSSLGVGVAPPGTAGDAYVNTSIGVGATPSTVAGRIDFGAANGPIIIGNRLSLGRLEFFVNGGTYSQGFYIQSGGITHFLQSIGADSGIVIGSDNNANTMAREPLNFVTASIATATNYGCFKTVKAITIENFEVSDELATGCAAGSVMRVYSCGASAPANAACSGGTQLTTGTTSTTAGTVVDGTINSANVAAGQYVCAQTQALGASCSAVQLSGTVMARPQ